ncbi:MAG: mannose-1-phosphate guanylyltransferase [Sandaracinaceae bacterium]
MTSTYTIVMAGGSGTRFWPLSRRARPKQLLPLAGGEESLLAATVRRVSQLSPAERVLVVTNALLAEATRDAVPDVPMQNVMAEPVGRNTAPCVGWAAARVFREDPEAVCMVLPADHHIGDEARYVEVLEQAVEAARGGGIVTVGIRPTRPETSYGYIEIGESRGDAHVARRFVEKPNHQRAEQFLAAGNFLWNSGMFFFRASVMLDAIRTHLPGLGQTLDRYLAVDLDQEAALVAETYGELPRVSIDHGVMEKVSEVFVVPGEFGWSDLGGFASAWELAHKDDDGNALPDRALTLDVSNCLVRAPAGKRVALIGVSDLVVIDTDDALLVVPRARAQEVKAIVGLLDDDA